MLRTKGLRPYLLQM